MVVQKFISGKEQRTQRPYQLAEAGASGQMMPIRLKIQGLVQKAVGPPQSQRGAPNRWGGEPG